MLDTNIISYLWKNDPIAQRYTPHLEGRILVISFVTVGELYFWAEDAGWGKKRRQLLETNLRNFIVVPSDHEIARCYGRVVRERKRQGRPITLNDAWIAASAIRHGVKLVTHNAKDFEGISDLDVVFEAS
ncbi:MAG: type II toxin-antitoxin system VapC family toxin [Candidatus Sumerlaeia bacterium]|nr:type II toxin-antitoxin system VapC family toxin [Candidatus Sumerlaeia bacterium]